MTRYSPNSMWLRLLLIILLVLGIFFRFVNLDRKVYWYDETITSLRLAGYTKEELTAQVADRIIDIQTLQSYQHISPNRSIVNTVQSLAIGNPEQPPLYYAMARLWVQLFGDSVAAIRSLSAVLSLLVFPSFYWLCLELFETPAIGWCAVALLAISPFHVLYSQEARPYSLLTALILLSTACLLRAVRLDKQSNYSDRQAIGNWGPYAIAIILGLYTQLLFILVLIGHAIYIALMNLLSTHRTKTPLWSRVRGYVSATLLGFLALIPWLLSMIDHFDGIGWITKKITLLQALTRLSISLASLFLDVQIGTQERLVDVVSGVDDFIWGNGWFYLTLPLLGLMGYACKFLWQNSSKSVAILIFSLIGSTAIPLILKDLIWGGQRSTIARYLIPSYLGIQIAVAYLLTQKLTSVKQQEQRFWQVVTVAIVSGSILSCSLSANAETWWNKYSSYYNPAIAIPINQSQQPLVIGGNAVRLTSLSYYLKSHVKLQVVPGDILPAIPPGFSDLFLFTPSRNLLSAIEGDRRYQIEAIYPKGNLWRLRQ